MIQFNLLPDVKKEYIRIKRTKRLIISISTLVSIAAIVLLAVVFSYVQLVQKKSINDLTKDVETEVAKVKSISGINEILTIQNQLENINTLHTGKPAVSRFYEYMLSVTPEKVFISTLDIDVANSTMEITGPSDSLADVNIFVDTLKFATYTYDQDGEAIKGVPFSNVLTSSSRSKDTSSYTIELQFDPILFDNTKNVSIVVPKNTITTRSVTGQPSIDSNNDLFKESPNPGDGGEQ